MALDVWTGLESVSHLSSICGALALLCVLLWPHVASYHQAVTVQSVGAAAFAVQFLLLGAWTAAGASALSCVQLICAATFADRRIVRAVAAVSLVALVIMAGSTWSGATSMLALCGSMAGAAARLQKSTVRMKMLFLIGAPFWLMHNLLVGAVFALCVDGVSIVGNLTSVSRTLRRRGYKVFDPLHLMQPLCVMPPVVDPTAMLPMRYA